MKALFIVNRRSGTRRRRDIADVIRQSCVWEYSIAESARKEDLDPIIADATAKGVDVVYAVGGDGTVHEVAKRLIGKQLALGILPTGSGNGFARHLGIPMDARRSLESCSQQRVVEIDTAMVNGTPFVGTMGVGFDAWIAEQFATSETRGFRSYALITLRGLFGYQSVDFDVTIDGEQTKRSALIIAIANASQYGNNARIAPLASLQDGMLDIVIIDRMSLFAVPAAAARLFAGSLDRARGVTMLRGKRIDIRRAHAGAAHVDGEPVSLPEQLTIEVVPRSLRVLIPDSATRV